MAVRETLSPWMPLASVVRCSRRRMVLPTVHKRGGGSRLDTDVPPEIANRGGYGRDRRPNSFEGVFASSRKDWERQQEEKHRRRWW